MTVAVLQRLDNCSFTSLSRPQFWDCSFGGPRALPWAYRSGDASLRQLHSRDWHCSCEQELNVMAMGVGVGPVVADRNDDDDAIRNGATGAS